MSIMAALIALSGMMGQTSEAGLQSPYSPIAGGWTVQISADMPETAALRAHRRPLFPPADKSMIWNADQQEKLVRFGFRPLVLAYIEPRFLFDYHSAGGLLGHLQAGLVKNDTGKWFHQWEQIEVRYVDGRMEYLLHDSAFPGQAVRLFAAPLAHSAGLILKVQVEGNLEDCSLVWGYGGASGFFTNYAMNAPEFTFAPAQCQKDHLQWTGQSFTLRRPFDSSDVIMKEVFGAGRYLPQWEARVQGGSSWSAKCGLGHPEAFTESPTALRTAAKWIEENTAQEQTNCVAVQEISLSSGTSEGYLVVGMGGDIETALCNPAQAYADALARNKSIGERVVLETPDPYLNAAATMMAFATEGTWGDSSVLHGGWSWRFAYLGWRGWYGMTGYGWTDRVKRSIENHTRLSVLRKGDDAGALGSMLEYEPGVFYNMNEVFLDQTRQYFDYTNDLELMREIFPVLKGIVAWEDRRLQPGAEALYENSLNTWISDSHWYTGGQCTQASAYMLGAYTFLAELAGRLGENSEPFQKQGERIRYAMQRKLWMPDRGIFAEYRDTRGRQMLHTEPELPTLYHSAEFGAASPLQISQMLRWADANLRQDTPTGGGRLYWSSNWFPNRGRTYTHSTYEMAYGENLNLALTYYQAGRAEDAYRIVRATLNGIYNGPTPGGLSCHADSNGRQRANDEFADASSMWGRTVLEGLFGIRPDRPKGVIIVSPQFPNEWQEARITSPQLSYHWQREEGRVRLEWESPVETALRLRLPIAAEAADRVEVDGKPVKSIVEQGYDGINWLCADTSRTTKGAVSVTFTPQTIRPVDHCIVYPPPPAPAPWTYPAENIRDLSQWTLVDLSTVYNSSVTEVLRRVEESAKPPDPPASAVGWNYWKSHLRGYHGDATQQVSDAGWRAKIGPDDIGWTGENIPFRSPKEGPNIAVVTRAGGFPETLEFPVNASGTTLYLMISGMTFPAQSHVPNLRVGLRYVDGQTDSTDLVNPFTLGDCWSVWCGRFHDCAANGFENLGGRTGPASSREVSDLGQPIAMDTEAQLVALPLRQSIILDSIRLEAVANDIIFGIMGASIISSHAHTSH